MSSRRMIDPSFWQSETIAELTEGDRLFFIGLISNADDQGRLRGHPSLLRSLIYPFDNISCETIEHKIEALSSVDCIFVYDDNDKKAIQIINWWKYQSPQWAYPSKIDPPEGWSDRLRYRSDNKVCTDNWNGDGGFTQKDSDNDYTNLPKDLPKSLGKDLGGLIELELELDNNTTIPPTNFQKACISWENNIGSLNQIISDNIRTYTAECPDGWVEKAIKEAAENNVRKWTYIKTILDSWLAAGQITEKSKNKPNGVNKRGRKQVVEPTAEAIERSQKLTEIFNSRS